MGDFEKIPERRKVSQYILGNARTLMIAFILFTIVVVMTTDIKVANISSIKDLGLDFFLLLFGSYGMYIVCADGGISKGYATEVYKTSVARFDGLKARIEESMLFQMNDFCYHYTDEELKKTRMQYLSLVCIPYEVYIEKYVNLGKREVKALPDLTSAQKKAIKKANKVKRIKLTPERVMTLGKTVHTRSVLAVTPDTMRNIAFGRKIVKMSLISFCMSMIAFEIIAKPSWTVFAEVCIKLATVIINGFDGHREGYDNITVHTVNYVNHQSSLMQQAIQYIETTTKE